MSGHEIPAILYGTGDAVGREIFCGFGWAWDVTEANRLAAGRPVISIILDPMREMLRRGHVEVNEVHASTANLARPLVAISAKRPPVLGGLLVVDGWHRIFKALQEGRTELPSVLLTEAEERACRLGQPGPRSLTP